MERSLHLVTMFLSGMKFLESLITPKVGGIQKLNLQPNAFKKFLKSTAIKHAASRIDRAIAKYERRDRLIMFTCYCQDNLILFNNCPFK